MTNIIRFTFWAYWLLGTTFLFMPAVVDIIAAITAFVLLITNTSLIIWQLIKTGAERELLACLVADIIAWAIAAVFLHLTWALRNGC